jgi:hypothetical protein
MLIEGLEDFVAWLKGPAPLEQEREKIRAIEEKRKACAKELGLLPNQAGLSDAVEQFHRLGWTRAKIVQTRKLNNFWLRRTVVDTAIADSRTT